MKRLLERMDRRATYDKGKEIQKNPSTDKGHNMDCCD